MDPIKLGQHISEPFNQELEDIRHKVSVLGQLVQQQLEFALHAFITMDTELAEGVIKLENQVDLIHSSLDQKCVNTLALRQPTAFDLRMLVTVIKVVNDLILISDQAERMCKMIIQSANVNSKKGQYHELHHMGELVKTMLKNSLDAFIKMSTDDIAAMSGIDQILESEHTSICRQLISSLMEDPRNITRTLDALLAVKALERIGDYICHICGHLVYMMTGEITQKYALTKQ